MSKGMLWRKWQASDPVAKTGLSIKCVTFVLKNRVVQIVDVNLVQKRSSLFALRHASYFSEKLTLGLKNVLIDGLFTTLHEPA